MTRPRLSAHTSCIINLCKTTTVEFVYNNISLLCFRAATTFKPHPIFHSLNVIVSISGWRRHPRSNIQVGFWTISNRRNDHGNQKLRLRSSQKPSLLMRNCQVSLRPLLHGVRREKGQRLRPQRQRGCQIKERPHPPANRGSEIDRQPSAGLRNLLSHRPLHLTLAQTCHQCSNRWHHHHQRIDGRHLQLLTETLLVCLRGNTNQRAAR
jgi:hypothetical protein